MELSLAQRAEVIPKRAFPGDLGSSSGRAIRPCFITLPPRLPWGEQSALVYFMEGTFITCRSEAHDGDTKRCEPWSLPYGDKSLPEEVAIKQSPITI